MASFKRFRAGERASTWISSSLQGDAAPGKGLRRQAAQHLDPAGAPSRRMGDQAELLGGRKPACTPGSNTPQPVHPRIVIDLENAAPVTPNPLPDTDFLFFRDKTALVPVGGGKIVEVPA